MKFGLERRSKKSEAEGARKTKFEKPLTYLLSGMMLVGGAHGASKMAEKQAEAQREKQRKELVQRHEREMRARESDRERLTKLASERNPIAEQFDFDRAHTDIRAETVRAAAEHWYARNMEGDFREKFSGAAEKLERHWSEIGVNFERNDVPTEFATLAIQESYLEDTKDGKTYGAYQLTKMNVNRFHVRDTHSLRETSRGAAELIASIGQEMHNRGIEEPAFVTLAYNGTFAVPFLLKWKKNHPDHQPTIDDFCRYMSDRVNAERARIIREYGRGKDARERFHDAVYPMQINIDYLAKFEGTLRTIKKMQDDNRIHVTMVGHSDPSTLVAQGSEKSNSDRREG
ncbi:MAG: hypothetical protein HGB18_00300 [Candidatus Moranbacteria bacterium]|nr:hypothetical protein [Candidatus Moranbacteria bacterium]